VRESAAVDPAGLAIGEVRRHGVSHEGGRLARGSRVKIRCEGHRPRAPQHWHPHAW